MTRPVENILSSPFSLNPHFPSFSEQSMEVTQAINKLCFLHCTLHRQKAFTSSQYLSFSNIRGALVATRAKKKNKKKDKSDSHKSESHSYVGRSDEALGFFPEAVLLQKKAVKEDNQTLPQFADAEQEKLHQALSLQMESDLNLERMRHYEVVFLINEKYDDEVEEIVTKVEDFIREKKGRIWRLNDWGLRRLAYRIKQAYSAHYILMNFEINTKFINEFKTILDKEDKVIRHLVTKEKKAETEYCPPPMEYHTLLARQGFKYDDGLSDDDEDYIMDDDDNDDDEGDDEGDGNEDDGGVIYVDGNE